jgi:phosphatidylserine/phosphatidylglycerophosphate/cardiolipin synthase-like enzyme
MARDTAPDGATAKLLITAQEGFPELERLFLGTKREIWAGFRIFDPNTRLRSEAGRAIGRDWADLFLHRLRAGVRIHLLLSDFDPHLAVDFHALTSQSARRFREIVEEVGEDAFVFRPDMHMGRMGNAVRLLFWRSALRKCEHDLSLRKDIADLLKCSAQLAARVTLDKLGKPIVAFRPPPHIIPGTHHQKLAVFDRETLFIGGLDVDERRWDDPDHQRPAEKTWQDVSVVVEGKAVEGAQAHLESLFDPKRPVPPAAPPFLRTLSKDGSRNPFRLSPVTKVREIEKAHLALFARARKLIYIETQFLRYLPIAGALARAAKRNPELRLIVMLPAAPEEVAFLGSGGLDSRFGEDLQAKCVRRLQKAFGSRLFIGMPLRPVRRQSDGRDAAWGAEIIYIHSKVAIADDSAAIVSSANLNGRSLRWDTEAGVSIEDASTVRYIRRRLFAHWLPKDADERYFDLETARDCWAALGEDNLRRAVEARQGFVAPYDPEPGEEFGIHVPLPDEIV